MKETLYIRLRSVSPEAITAAALWSPEGGLQNLSATLPELAGRATDRRVVVFVPAADVRLASIEVPARSLQKVLQAAPYVLEEQIAEDVDTLHFALGPRQAAGGYPVAIVARERIDSWLGALTASGIQPDVLVPEHLSLPWGADDRVPVLIERGEVIARTAAFQGLSCLPDDLPAYLQIADPDNRYSLRVFVLPEFSPDLSQLGRPVELLPGHRSALEVLVKHWRPETSINLLQGAYSRREKMSRAWGPWRLPAALAAGWLLLCLVAAAVDAYRLSSEAEAQAALNVQRFQTLFPDEKRIIDLTAQLEQKVAALKSGTANQGMLRLLEPVAGAMSTVPGLAVQNLQFREGALYLNLTGPDLQALEQLRAWFDSHPGTSLEVQSANAGAEGVQIRLKLTPA